jgi:hypothetical protein
MSKGNHYELAPYPKNLEEPEVRNTWAQKAFAPLQNYLARYFPEEQDKIIDRLMFMGHGGSEGTDFIYKNSLTREYLVLSNTGDVVKKEPGALL